MMSSIKRNIDLPTEAVPKDKTAECISELMIDAQKNFKKDFTKESFFNWHRMLMKDNVGIQTG